MKIEECTNSALVSGWISFGTSCLALVGVQNLARRQLSDHLVRWFCNVR